jgi:ABC-2 type transport system ATP-binding protein
MTHNGQTLIEAAGLTKRYGNFVAVEDLTFSVARGEVVAFLGPNGAGKSTTMRLLTGFLSPTSGTAKIAGFDVARDRIAAARCLGYLPENGPLYPDMTPAQTLNFFARARGLAGAAREQAIERVTKICQLGNVLHKPVFKLSKGYRQRVGLAQALLHSPDVLILDEPTSGLDPNQIRDVRTAIREIGQGCAILLSTHILGEVEAIADRVVMINKGKLVFQGTPSEMRASGTAEEFFHAHTAAKDAEQAGAATEAKPEVAATAASEGGEA